MAATGNTTFLGTLSMPEDKPGAKTMIDVDHVSMVFNIASEQLNSLKEYAIALSRRELRFKEFYALDDVSFQVKQGDVFGILGTNGSGKSTILKIIAGVLEPTKGSCTVEGSIAPLIELGAGFDLELTARENIFLNGALLGYSKKFIQQHFDEIVEFAEVKDFLDMPMKNYSSGMVARIAFAIATVIIPDVLIVDEVLSVGDFMFQQKCEQRIQSLIKDHGVTVLIVSHNNAQIERLCNKAVWIEKGHLRAIGAAKEVCKIYRAIGGRTGSPESEAIVLDTLRSIKSETEPTSDNIAGENRFGTAAKMATYAETTVDTVILTNSDNAKSNYIAWGLCGLLNAIVLTTQAETIPDATMQELRHIKPNQVIAIGDPSSISEHCLSMLRSQFPSTSITKLESQAPMTGLSTLRFGDNLSDSNWATSIIVSQDPPLDETLVSLSPLIFQNKIPMVFFKENDFDNELDSQRLAQFDSIVLIGTDEALPQDHFARLNPNATIVRLDGNGFPQANCRTSELARSLHLAKRSEASKVIITSPQGVIDNYCLGVLAGRMEAEVLFVDPLDLNSIAETIYKLKANAHAQQLLFIGNDLRFSKVDKILFEAALKH